MKAFALLLASCMLLLNMESFAGSAQVAMNTEAMACCADCCSGCGDAENEQQAEKKSCDTEQGCQPDCECSFQLQTTAIAYNFAELIGSVVVSYHYGSFVNSYTFQFSADFLHPPRFG